MTRPRALQAAEIVRQHAVLGITRGQLAWLMTCSPRTAAQHLRHARAAGLVSVTGIGRYARWLPAVAPAGPAAAARRVASVWELAA